jgi:hypothetical protein
MSVIAGCAPVGCEPELLLYTSVIAGGEPEGLLVLFVIAGGAPELIIGLHVQTILSKNLLHYTWF